VKYHENGDSMQSIADPIGSDVCDLGFWLGKDYWGFLVVSFLIAHLRVGRNLDLNKGRNIKTVSIGIKKWAGNQSVKTINTKGRSAAHFTLWGRADA
jgi:hypothetical protein